ncbi:MAG: glycosyltransferase family 4 protein [Desulfovibrionaceae bacterium]
MKILQVINVRWYNATAWYALYLSRLLHDAGHEVVVAVQPDTPPEERARKLGLATMRLDLNTTNPLRLYSTLGDMLRLLKEFRPQVVNCHRGEGFVLWGLIKKLGMGYKLVRTRGDQRLPRSDSFNRWLHRKVADAVVVTNQKMARHFLSTMKTPEGGVWLIHGGVDRETFAFDPEGRERVRAEFGFAQEDFVVGLLGRFDEVKGQRELIHAVARLRSERGLGRLRLFLIGFETATRLRRVEEWIKEAGLGDAAAISHHRDDVAACISALDLGVVASLWSEAIARAALEIMSCGRPLISSNVNVMPDLVPEEGIYDVDDPDGLFALLGRAATDDELRARLVQAHAATMSQLSGADFLNRTLNLYQSLLED